MLPSSPSFHFGPLDDALMNAAFVLHIPGGLADKTTLLLTYATLGRFPTYFGFNWDALNDCLRAFSWADERRILIIHDDLPLAGMVNELRTYLEILDGAVELWRERGQHELLVSFPMDTEDKMRRVLDETN